MSAAAPGFMATPSPGNLMTASRARALMAHPALSCPAVGRWCAPTALQGREVRLGCGEGAAVQLDPSAHFLLCREALRAVR